MATRLQISLPAKYREILEELRRATAARSHAAVVRDAVLVYRKRLQDHEKPAAT